MSDDKGLMIMVAVIFISLCVTARACMKDQHACVKNAPSEEIAKLCLK